MSLFFIEVTDVYGGEANYLWATHHVIRGKSLRGALQRFSRMSCLNWRSAGCNRYDSTSGATCLFIDEYDEDAHGDYPLQTDDRK